ncbi:GNAT family N-acetyltransferase [Actinotalea sp. Marseille-Q4924]|uniref:GNAT family N-acetyltransferase n=1 Tax=Actinotalea sp. Marseille-Q4924 TaxID=2866571 RepID=UPI001CE45BE6|nr:GNAT family N-acetyltransferase [Actinotalea sp. Marseille-Q4924]
MTPEVLGPVWASDRMLLGDRARWAGATVSRTGDERSLLVAAERGDRLVLFGRGEPGGVVELLRDRVAALRSSAGLGVAGMRGAAGTPGLAGWMSVPRGAVVPEDVLRPLHLEPFSTWDWLLAEAPPGTVAGEDVVVPLDPIAEASAIADCLAEANPGTTADPTGPHEAAWVGVRDEDGGLLGVFGAQTRGGAEEGGFSWHLHGLGVRPALRGRGLGAALTAALSRAGFAAGAQWVSLGMYADNEVARRIYHRLGFATLAEFSSFGPAGSTRPPT